MNKDEYLNKIHVEILEIMDVIDDLCQKHNLHYYMTGGTLLGAVRHGGFIPWDDDLDIIMPRNDYNSFIEICSVNPPAGFSLKWITTEKNYWRSYAKLSKNNTAFIERVSPEKNTESGIFVDIFPIDETAGCTQSVQRRKKIIVKLENAIAAQYAPDLFHGIKKIVLPLIPHKVLFMLCIHYMTASNGKNRSFYSNFGSQYPIKKKTVEKIKLGDGKRIKFENRLYMAPDFPEDVLTNTFGTGYREIPPKEKRKTHYPTFVKFSDGTEIAFEEPKNRLKIADTLSKN